MACRDGFLKLACKVMLFYVGRGLVGQGPDLLGHFFDVLALCSKVCRSFAISFCPAPELDMRIQILNGIASEKFLVKKIR